MSLTNKKNNIILGSDISGLSVAYHLRLQGTGSIVLEKDDTYGELYSNFEINEFLIRYFGKWNSLWSDQSFLDSEETYNNCI